MDDLEIQIFGNASLVYQMVKASWTIAIWDSTYSSLVLFSSSPLRTLENTSAPISFIGS